MNRLKFLFLSLRERMPAGQVRVGRKLSRAALPDPHPCPSPGGRGVLLLLSLLFAPFFVAGIASAAPTPSGVAAIAAYAGNWKGTTKNFATPYSKAAKTSDTLRNDCWSDSDFYVCRQIVNGKPAPVLSVYTYDAKTDIYHVYSVPAHGGNSADSGELIIKGNVWTFPWEYQHDRKTMYFRVVNVWSSSNTIEYRQEFSADQIHWTLMAKGHEIRDTH